MKILHAALDRLEVVASLIGDANQVIDHFLDETVIAYVDRRFFGSIGPKNARHELEKLGRALKVPPTPITPAGE